jgi:hypothetical protein
MNVKRLNFDEIEDLKREWTEKWVEVDTMRPELKRFAGRPGRVVTVNMSGRALVQFDEGEGFGWGRFDIAIPFLKQVAAPAPKAKEGKHAGEKPKAAAPAGEAKPAAKMSPLEMMKAQAARKAAAGGADAKPQPAAAPAEPKPAGKMSPIELMRAKAAAKAAQSATPPAVAGAAPEVPATAPESKPAGKMSPLDFLRAKAAAKKAEEGKKAE